MNFFSNIIVGYFSDYPEQKLFKPSIYYPDMVLFGSTALGLKWILVTSKHY